MKTIIAGSRTIKNVALICDAIEAAPFPITEVVCGGADGVDNIGNFWAQAEGILVKRFWPDWNKHGKAAGPIRNRAMAEYADALILVWDGQSRGSASMKREAQRAGIPIHEVIVTPEQPVPLP